LTPKGELAKRERCRGLRDGSPAQIDNFDGDHSRKKISKEKGRKLVLHMTYMKRSKGGRTWLEHGRWGESNARESKVNVKSSRNGINHRWR